MTSDGEVYQTLIIGAGPAGLAVGACLKHAGMPCVLLEQADVVGASWHSYYDRLHLHTPKASSALPWLSFPAAYPRYPSRLHMIDYLEAYARHFQLAIRFGQQVVSVRSVRGCWHVRTRDAHYQATNLVIATGYTRVPHLPTWPGQELFHGTILHSCQYRNGAPFAHQRVLVVGFGNSGGEIAMDLWEHGAQPSIAVRGPVNVIPRDLFGIPILTIGRFQRWLPPRVADVLNAPLLRAAMGDLARYGLRSPPRGPLAQIQRTARIPLIDVGTLALIKRGQVAVRPAIASFTVDGVIFADGEQQPFEAVILATGYRPQVSAFLDAALVYDAEGAPLSSGYDASGLYFCGYHVSAGGMLREIGREAQRISAAIARKCEDTANA